VLTRNSGVHLLEAYRFPLPVPEHPPKVPEPGAGRTYYDQAIVLHHEVDSVPGNDLQAFADLLRQGDLTLTREGAGGQGASPYCG